jgi:hypothetical protein
MPDEVSRTGSFIATAAALRLYEIVIMEACVRHRNLRADTRRFLQTADGRPVHRKEKGRYQLAASGLALRSFDPTRP